MTPEALRPHLPLWGLGAEAPLRLLHRSENATFLAGEGEEALVLRLHRAGYHEAAEIRSELDWLRALRAADTVPCVAPVPQRNGALIATLALDGVPRHLVAFAPIAGREPAPEEDLAPLFRRLGATAARLHLHARAWRRPAGFVRKRWDVETILGPEPHWGDWRDAPGLNGPGAIILGRLARALADRLGAYGAEPSRFGLVHADLRLANLLLAPDGVHVIDFDDCGFSWWMYDFAASVSFIEDDPRLPELAALWVEGYCSEAPLAAEEVAILPVLVMLRRLLLTAWLGSRADSDTAALFGGPAFTRGTVALAERFLARGPVRFWSG